MNLVKNTNDATLVKKLIFIENIKRRLLTKSGFEINVNNLENYTPSTVPPPKDCRVILYPSIIVYTSLLATILLNIYNNSWYDKNIFSFLAISAVIFLCVLIAVRLNPRYNLNWEDYFYKEMIKYIPIDSEAFEVFRGRLKDNILKVENEFNETFGKTSRTMGRDWIVKRKIFYKHYIPAFNDWECAERKAINKCFFLNSGAFIKKELNNKDILNPSKAALKRKNKSLLCIEHAVKMINALHSTGLENCSGTIRLFNWTWVLSLALAFLFASMHLGPKDDILLFLIFLPQLVFLYFKLRRNNFVDHAKLIDRELSNYIPLDFHEFKNLQNHLSSIEMFAPSVIQKWIGHERALVGKQLAKPQKYKDDFFKE